MCRSRRELSNEYLLGEIGVDTAENVVIANMRWKALHEIYKIYILHPRGTIPRRRLPTRCGMTLLAQPVCLWARRPRTRSHRPAFQSAPHLNPLQRTVFSFLHVKKAVVSTSSTVSGDFKFDVGV